MRTNLITRLKEEWNNLDPVDPLRGLIADAIDALAEAQPSKPLTDEQAETAFKAWHYKHGNNTQGIKWVDDLLRSCWKAAIEAAHQIGVEK